MAKSLVIEAPEGERIAFAVYLVDGDQRTLLVTYNRLTGKYDLVDGIETWNAAEDIGGKEYAVAHLARSALFIKHGLECLAAGGR